VNGPQEVTYAVEFHAGKKRRNPSDGFGPHLPEGHTDGGAVPRIARLVALALRFEGLLREGEIKDYVALARLGRVTRARMTQIMKLVHLAPDIQEQILFLPDIRGFNERNLRPVVGQIDWDDQRRIFRKIMDGLERGRPAA
jgi:hypothetical protein